MAITPGWYPDPEYPGQQRYWDGQQWTEHRAPVAQPPPPPQQAPSATYPPTEQLRQSSSSNRIGVIVVGGLIAVIALIGGIGMATDSNNDEDGADPTPSASPHRIDGTPIVKPEWKSTVTDIEVVNPATVRMFVNVKNVGDAAGTPKCTLRARDPGYNYTGFTFVNLKNPIKPGKSANFFTAFTVTNEGAAYARKGTVKCQTRPSQNN